MTEHDLEAYLDVEEREAKKIDSNNLAELLRWISRHPGPLWAGLGMIVVATFATLLEPRIFGYAIDDAIIPHRWTRLKQLVIVYFAVTLVRTFSTILQSWLFELLGQRVTQDLRCELFSHLQRQPIRIYDKNPAGRLLTRVTNDIASLSEMFTAGFVSMVGNALMVVGILVWLIVLDWKLGLISGAVFPILVWASVYFSEKLRISYREARSKLSALNAFLAENLLGMKVVHLFNREKLHLERFDRINNWYTDAQVGAVRVYALFQPTITWCSAVAVALVIWYGGIDSLNGTMKLGVLVTYFSYVLSMFQPLREIADKWNVFLSGMSSAERIFSIFRWTPELSSEEAEGPSVDLGAIAGRIVFENVWFAYDAEHWVLKDFSLVIEPGMRVGVVGHTGAGKTTLISLLMRFYEPQKGRILLDGKDLRDYSRRSLRAAIGIVQQDVFVFSGSLRDNVTFWETQSAVTGPARALIEELPTREIGERGANLSMGQKQKVAFARALSASPQVWILDEATANMDSGSEIGIQRALDEGARGHTQILIAHRLATVRTADKILVLHKGALLEQGRHQELIDANGIYARLYRYQEAQERSLSAGVAP